ncbi:MAG: DUF6483 family protein [Clostridiaceae bacterium]
MLKINVNSELIRKFSEVIEGILAMIEKKEYVKALNMIDNAFKEFFRLGENFFTSLSEENLLDMVKTNSILDADKCIIVSKLLMEDARVTELIYGKAEGFYLYGKSLYLYIEAFINVDGGTELDKYFKDIDLLMNKLSDYKLDMKLQKQIILYHVKNGRYAEAEDILYEMLEDKDYSDDLKAYAAELYKALLLKDDAELEKGNLPREEIINSLDSLS